MAVTFVRVRQRSGPPVRISAIGVGPWAIHRSMGGGWAGGEWTVTHVASGMGVCDARDLDEARAIVAALPPEQQVLAESLWLWLMSPTRRWGCATTEAIAKARREARERAE